VLIGMDDQQFKKIRALLLVIIGS